MVNFGAAETSLIFAQNVELLVGTDQYILMRGVDIEKSHPETRVDHGRTRTYGHAAPDIAIRFMLSASTDIFADLKTKSTRNSHGVLPSYKWNIKCTASDGGKKNLAISGKLFYFKVTKPDNSVVDPVDAECQIRLTDETVVIT